MSDLLTVVAIVVTLTGTFFSVVGVLGFWRLPDVYTRLHATGKVGIFGVVLLLVAAALVLAGGAWSRALVLIVLLLLVGPVTAHAISSAAYRLQLPMRGAERDDLAAAAERSGVQPGAGGD